MPVGGVSSNGASAVGLVPVHEPASEAAGAAGLASAKLQGSAELDAIARGEATFANGSRGDGVKRLQQGLLAAGYALPKYGADGGFGGEGMAAVKQLQRDAGLPQTGIVDQKTLHALDAKLAGAGGTKPATSTGSTGGASATSGASSSSAAGAANPRFAALASVAAGKTVLGPGSKGDGVKAAQQALMDMGFDLPKFGADGGYGSEMVAAVKRFQIDQGLPRTGKVDKATLAAMQKFAPPPGKTLEKFPEYDRIYEDGRADMTLAFGHDEDGSTAGQVESTLRGLQQQGFRRVTPGSLSPAERAKYGLTPDRVDPGISYWVKDFKDPATGKPVVAVTKILTPDSASTPEGVAKLFQKAIQDDDVVMYDGHARYGTGPDFDDIDSARGNFLINPAGNYPDMGADPAPAHLLDALKSKPGASLAGTTVPKDKYRLLFFDACSSENYIPSLKSGLKGAADANTDIVASTMPLSFGSGPAQLLNMVSGVTGRKSIDAINRMNDDAEIAAGGDPVKAKAAMLASGFLGNSGNRAI
ncbi:MAG TPA: peptidoglycan-binding domain-containing protein [Planctomycetota bacterium]|nr:peptidoglycan-binding domain-containing protein [Planctomycetota bacterium]